MKRDYWLRLEIVTAEYAVRYSEEKRERAPLDSYEQGLSAGVRMWRDSMRKLWGGPLCLECNGTGKVDCGCVVQFTSPSTNLTFGCSNCDRQYVIPCEACNHTGVARCEDEVEECA